VRKIADVSCSVPLYSIGFGFLRHFDWDAVYINNALQRVTEANPLSLKHAMPRVCVTSAFSHARFIHRQSTILICDADIGTR